MRVCRHRGSMPMFHTYPIIPTRAYHNSIVTAALTRQEWGLNNGTAVSEFSRTLHERLRT
jgi:hypothetical protein